MRRKRKPDLLAVLAVVVGLGVIATSLAQGMRIGQANETYLASNQAKAVPSGAVEGTTGFRTP